MKRLMLLLLLIQCGLSNAGPNDTVSALMDDRLTMFDWGMYRMERYLDSRLPVVIRQYLSHGGSNHNLALVTFYDRQKDNIVVQIGGSAETDEPETQYRKVIDFFRMHL